MSPVTVAGAVSGVSASTDRLLRRRVPGLVAWAVRVAAAFAVLDVLLPHRRPAFEAHHAAGLVLGAAFAAAICAAGAMLLLAGALQRRRRRAWVLLVGVVAVAAVADGTAHRYRVLAVNLLLLGLLAWTRRDFQARSLRPTRLLALRVLVVMGAISVLAGIFLTRRTAPADPLGHRLVQVCLGLLGFTPELAFRRPGTATVTEVALAGMGGLTALSSLAVLLAPVRKHAGLAGADETRLRCLLARFGDRDSLGYFALRGDKSVVFSASGKAAVSYRVVGPVTLASGDPLGDPEAWPGAIEAWLAEAARYGWVPGVIGASETAALAYGRAGLDALELGDEAVLDLSDRGLTDPALAGPGMRAVLRSAEQARAAGYRVQVDRQRDLSAERLADLAAAARLLPGARAERGFSMALDRLCDPADPDLVLARVRDQQDRLVALLAFAPWGDSGLSLGQIRGAGAAHQGVVDAAVVELLAWAQAAGVRRVSLNFAVFRSGLERGARIGAGPVLRGWRRVLLLASTWWQIDALYRANARYGPQWQPRYICFPRAVDLPRVSLAALEAEAIIRRPRLRWLLG